MLIFIMIRQSISFMSGMLDINAFEGQLAQMLAAEGTRETTKSLKVEAAPSCLFSHRDITGAN